jgi:hypothetical protein
MNKTTKVILGVAVPLAVFGGYWFIYRNREPFLDLEGTDWINDIINLLLWAIVGK